MDVACLDVPQSQLRNLRRHAWRLGAQCYSVRSTTVFHAFHRLILAVRNARYSKHTTKHTTRQSVVHCTLLHFDTLSTKGRDDLPSNVEHCFPCKFQPGQKGKSAKSPSRTAINSTVGPCIWDLICRIIAKLSSVQRVARCRHPACNAPLLPLRNHIRHTQLWTRSDQRSRAVSNYAPPP